MECLSADLVLLLMEEYGWEIKKTRLRPAKLRRGFGGTGVEVIVDEAGGL